MYNIGFGLLVIQNKEFEPIVFRFGDYNGETSAWGFMESENNRCFQPDAKLPDWQSEDTPEPCFKVMNFFLGNFISLVDYLFFPPELSRWMMKKHFSSPTKMLFGHVK